MAFEKLTRGSAPAEPDALLEWVGESEGFARLTPRNLGKIDDASVAFEKLIRGSAPAEPDALLEWM